jgi:hypothetical protein
LVRTWRLGRWAGEGPDSLVLLHTQSSTSSRCTPAAAGPARSCASSVSLGSEQASSTRQGALASRLSMRASHAPSAAASACCRASPKSRLMCVTPASTASQHALLTSRRARLGRSLGSEAATAASSVRARHAARPPDLLAPLLDAPPLLQFQARCRLARAAPRGGRRGHPSSAALFDRGFRPSQSRRGPRGTRELGAGDWSAARLRFGLGPGSTNAQTGSTNPATATVRPRCRSRRSAGAPHATTQKRAK